MHTNCTHAQYVLDAGEIGALRFSLRYDLYFVEYLQLHKEQTSQLHKEQTSQLHKEQISQLHKEQTSQLHLTQESFLHPKLKTACMNK